MSPRILLIEDDPDLAHALEALLTHRGYTVISAIDGGKGLAEIETGVVDLVITDVLMPNVDGIEMLCRVKQTHPRLPIIAMSGGHEIEPEYYLRLAKSLGADRTLLKPFGAQELFATVEAVLGQRSSPLPPSAADQNHQSMPV